MYVYLYLNISNNNINIETDGNPGFVTGKHKRCSRCRKVVEIGEKKIVRPGTIIFTLPNFSVNLYAIFFYNRP